MSSLTDSHGLPGISCHIVLYLPEKQDVEQFFTVSCMSAFTLICYMDSCACSLVLSMPMWFMYSWFNTFHWSDPDIIILLPFIVIPSVITISYLHDHYCCRSFCTLPLIDDQLCKTYSDSMLLPFIVIPSVITISYLHDHYCCRSFCTLPLIDDQLCKTYSDSMLLPFIVIPSVITISYLHDHYCCRSFCTLHLIDDQLCKTYYDSMLKC